MGIIIKQSIRNASITYIGVGLGLLSTIFLFPHILGAEKYGLTRSLIAITTISSQLITLGIPNTLLKFIPTLESDQRIRSHFFKKTVIPAMVLLALYLGTFFLFETNWLALYDDSALLEMYLWLVLPMVFASTTFTLFTAFIKASLNTVFATFLQDVFLRITILIALALYFFDLIDFHSFMLSFVGAYLLNMMILVVYSVKQGYYTFSKQEGIQKFKPKETFTYSFYAFFSGFTMILVSNIDLIMVDMFEGLENAGVYALAMYMGTVITVPRKSLAKIIHPILTKSFKENNLQEIARLYNQSSINQLLLSLIIYVGILISLDDLYRILPMEFQAGKPLIMILGLAYLFDLATGSNGQIIITSLYYRFDFISSVLLMLTSVFLNYLLIPPFGILGAAIATATSVGVYNIIKTIFVWWAFKIQPFSIQTIYILLLGLLSYFLGQFLVFGLHPILEILFRSLIVGSLYMTLAYIFKLSPEVNGIMSNVLKR
ncbi:MAG: hypothetical protein EBR32_01965 [Bacteroidetes bacterium]|nr:hypothetical protein [Bacteroidota bacterium]